MTDAQVSEKPATSTLASAPVALVSGASSGIGFQVAKQLSEKGFIVYGAARHFAELSEDSATTVGKGGFHEVHLDVTDEDECKKVVNYIVEHTGRIDVLVNNAGFAVFGAIETVSSKEAKRQFDTNVFGLANMTRTVLPHMRENRHGHIVMISSVAGRLPGYFGGWYHASKWAVEALSATLRSEVKPYGIAVTVVEPGAVATPWASIATDSLMEVSKGTAYEQTARRVAATMLDFYENAPISTPEQVGGRIVSMMTRKNPPRRFVVARGARLMLAAHALLPAAAFEAIERMNLTRREGNS